MSSDEFHVYSLETVSYADDQSIIIAFDIEDNAPVFQNAGAFVPGFDVCGLRPGCFFDFIDPRLQRLLCVRVRAPEITENLDGNQFHAVDNSPAMGPCQLGMM